MYVFRSISSYWISLLSLLWVLSACGGSDPSSDPVRPENPDEPAEPSVPDVPTSNYSELYRPQIHYTPARNWVNDPNGMVYVDGTWHLFYQYNPYGNDWGNMSWGHATSRDLIHWTEKPVALTPTPLGDIFSGSCVVDDKDVTGFGRGTICAFYTAASSSQQQAMAYSTDGGQTFVQYEGNPVIASNSPDFRDPKVFYHAPSHRWIMALATGNNHSIELWSSTNLLRWTQESVFTYPASPECNRGQWECPDLLSMTYDGQEYWVLLVNVNPGGPTAGSACMYFVGQFDGKTFTPNDYTYPRWVDYGMDNYAEVTWSNAPEGRIVGLGWMNNWLYAGAVPCTPWRSAFTLPKELTLTAHKGQLWLSSQVVREIDAIADPWQTVTDGILTSGKPYQLEIVLPAGSNGTITLSNAEGQRLAMDVNSTADRFSVHRNGQTGNVNFGLFSMPSVNSPLFADDGDLRFQIFVDASSVEVFGSEGRLNQTNLVFPSSIYSRVELSGMTGSMRVRTLVPIW